MGLPLSATVRALAERGNQRQRQTFALERMRALVARAFCGSDMSPILRPREYGHLLLSLEQSVRAMRTVRAPWRLPFVLAIAIVAFAGCDSMFDENYRTTQQRVFQVRACPSDQPTRAERYVI